MLPKQDVQKSERKQMGKVEEQGNADGERRGAQHKTQQKEISDTLIDADFDKGSVQNVNNYTKFRMENKNKTNKR